MFCKYCGNELTDDAEFCPKCGRKVNEVVTSTSGTVENQGNETDSGNRNHVVTKESINELGVSKSKFGNRIESTEDKETNDLLFSLYGKLVEPITAIEKDMANIQLNKEIINEHVRFHLSLVRSWLVFPYIIFCLLLTPIIYNFFGIDFFRMKASKQIISCIVVGFGIPVMFSIIRYIIQYFIYCHDRKYSYESIKVFEQDIYRIVEKLKPYIIFVPPAYRTSAALTYFYNAYMNTRVDNLAEAVKSYDTEKRHQELKGTIEQGTAMISSQLQEISYNQNMISSQLSGMSAQIAGLTASVWGASLY